MEQRDLEAVEGRLTSILLGWGAASTVLGSVLWAAGWRSRRTELLRFGRQTALWGATDSAIALAGSRARRRRGELDQAEVDAKARTLLITLVVNGIADVAYVAGGARVWARTGAAHPSTQDFEDASMSQTYWGMGRGDGAAIIIQGGFLLVLDSVFALRLSRVRH